MTLKQVQEAGLVARWDDGEDNYPTAVYFYPAGYLMERPVVNVFCTHDHCTDDLYDIDDAEVVFQYADNWHHIPGCDCEFCS